MLCYVMLSLSVDKQLNLKRPVTCKLLVTAARTHVIQTPISLGLGRERTIEFVENQTKTVHVRLPTNQSQIHHQQKRGNFHRKC